ncbi:MAG: 3-phosphoshikimate 1-carboxyvinyltransferase [Kiritimatiellia bacterium]
MDLRLTPATAPLKGRVSVPGDKSLAHRAALFAALAEGESTVRRYPDSGVTRAMRGALSSLGVGSTLENGVLRIRGNGYRPFPGSACVAHCGNSATTIRLLAGAVAGTGTACTLDGSEGLRKRPMGRIADPLARMGAVVRTRNGCAPLEFGRHALGGLSYDVPVASAQVLSCLQIAALGASAECRFTVPGPVRDHTVRMLTAMGADIASDGWTTRVRPLSRPLSPLDGTLAGDISSAAFLLCAAALVPGSRIVVAGVGVNETRTGILDVLKAMGANVTCANGREECGEPVADVALEAAPLKATEIRGGLVVRSIDELPAIAAVAAFAEGTTVVREARELRYKETDRIAAIVAQLRALGTEVDEFDDGFAVHGGTLTGGTARANGDHRLAMSMALCGLKAPVSVAGAEILDESFPEFVPTLVSLGAGAESMNG